MHNFKNWLQKILGGNFKKATPGRVRGRRRRVRLVIEHLEDRVVPSTITVTLSEAWNQINTGSGTGGSPAVADTIIVTKGATLTVTTADIGGHIPTVGTIDIGSSSPAGNGTLAFAASGSPTLNVVNSIVLGVNATETGKLDMTNASTLNIESGFTATSGDFTFAPGAGTVEFSGTATQDLPAAITTYNNLTYAGNSTGVLETATTVNGNLAISAGNLSVGSFSLTAAENATINGQILDSGNVAFTGNSSFTIINSGVVGGGGGAINITGGAYVSNSGTISSNSGPVSFTGTVSNSGTIGSGVEAGTIQFSGSLTNSGAIEMAGAGNLTITGNNSTTVLNEGIAQFGLGITTGNINISGGAYVDNSGATFAGSLTTGTLSFTGIVSNNGAIAQFATTASIVFANTVTNIGDITGADANGTLTFGGSLINNDGLIQMKAKGDILITGNSSTTINNENGGVLGKGITTGGINVSGGAYVENNGATIGGSLTTGTLGFTFTGIVSNNGTIGGANETKGMTFAGPVTNAGTISLGSGAGTITADSSFNNNGTVIAGSGTLTFAGAAAQTINGTGAWTLDNVNFDTTFAGGGDTLTTTSTFAPSGTTAVGANGLLYLGTSTVISGSGTFTLPATGTLGVASTGGIASSGATGNIQTGVRTFTAGSSFIFDGTASEVTGTGLPSSVSSLTIINSAGVSQSAATTAGSLMLTAGLFTDSNLTMASGGTITRTGGSLSAQPLNTSSAPYSVIYTSQSNTTGPEIPSNTGALANLTINPGANDTINLGSAVNASGNVTVTSGTLATANFGLSAGSNITVSSTATLTGSGTVEPAVALSGTLQAGNAAGIGVLTVGGLAGNAGSNFNVVLSTGPVSNAVIVNGSSAPVLGNITLNLDALSGYAAGGSLDILVNKTGSAITSDFANAPANHLIQDNAGYFYEISYTGSTSGGVVSATGGNDAVLTFFNLRVAMTAPANNSDANNNKPTLAATASDTEGPGLASVQFEYSNNGGASWTNAGAALTNAPFSYTFSSALADGTYEARGVATDNANNSATSLAVSFTIDTVAPTVSLTAPANNSYTNNNQPTLTASAADNSGGSGLASVQFQYSFDGGAWTNAGAAEVSGPFSYTFTSALPDGVYQARAVATDNAGNSATSTVSFTIDTTTPTVALTAPVNSTLTNNNEPTLSATASDTGSGLASVQFQYSENGGAWSNAGPALASAPYTYTFTAALPDGDYAFRAVATDRAGNSATTASIASSPSVLTTFYDSGPSPFAGLIEDNSGDLFGDTYGGGVFGAGSIFEIVAGTGAYSTLASFNDTDGANPRDSLLEDGSGNLYGTTNEGGAANDGTVFELPAGSGTITTLASFNNNTGILPIAGLIEDHGGNFFGTTDAGGTKNDGTVFELAAGSSTITTLASFNNNDGAYPAGNLVEDQSGNFFGTASMGGSSDNGTLFELAAGSTVITRLASFNVASGDDPQAGLILDSSGNLFGATPSGGADVSGTVFEVAAGTNAITRLTSFTYNQSGGGADGGVIEDSHGNLFGSTSNYVFELAPETSSITTLASFGGTEIGSTLVEDPSGNFFGTTERGGTSGTGTVFKVAASNSALTTLASLNTTTAGANPKSPLLEDQSGNLFGTTQWGGVLNDGTVFEETAGTDSMTTLVSFNGADGANPVAGLVEDQYGNLFGATTNSTVSYGTVFEIAAGTSAITTLASFGLSGYNPEGNLVLDQYGDIFGTCNQGSAAVFELPARSHAITLLAFFNSTNGATPEGGLVEDKSDNLFGTASGGGALGDGTIFELAAGSGTITDLASFNSIDGSSPEGSLVEDGNGNIFGTTYDGGASSDGTVFEMASGTSAITALASFNGLNGSFPEGGLIEDNGGNLYGTTAKGGASGFGTVFELAAGSTSITTLTSFNGFNGANSQSPLLEDQTGNLYGVTDGDNLHNEGTVFELPYLPSLIIETNGSNTATSITNDGPNPASTDQQIRFTVAVSPAVPNGETVTLEDADHSNQVVPSTGSLTGGTGFFTVAAGVLSAGTHHIFAVYMGDGVYLASQSSETAETVLLAPAVSSVTVNGSTAPIISASESGNTVTIVTDGSNGFTSGQTLSVDGVGAGYNGLATQITVVDTETFTYAVGGTPNSLATITDQGTATGAGASGLLSGSQRSMVDSIIYTFNQPVALSGPAISSFTLQNNFFISRVNQPNGYGTIPDYDFTSVDGGTTWILTFNGNGVVGNSIADGVYDITLDASDFTSIATGQIVAARGQDTFFRLFGNANGYNSLAQNAAVNGVDASRFGASYRLTGNQNQQNGYQAYFDYNDDGSTNGTDQSQFLLRYAKTWSGFTPTI